MIHGFTLILSLKLTLRSQKLLNKETIAGRLESLKA
jgi:hypothetical protein